MHLEIITPDRILFDGEVEMVIVNTPEGEMGFLPGHIWTLALLDIGEMWIREPEQEDARRNRVELTRKGREAVEGCEEAFLSVSQRMLAGFTAEEQEMLVDFRARMLNNLRRDASAPKEES
jgi:hypothetical protein